MSSLSSETSFFSSCRTTGQEENMTKLPKSPEMSSKTPKSSTLPPKRRKIKAAASLGTGAGFDGPGRWSTTVGRSPPLRPEQYSQELHLQALARTS